MQDNSSASKFHEADTKYFYFTSTEAPASSSFFFISSASSFDAPSLTGFGAASTRSLASFRPRPVIVLTSLITLIFLSPTAVKITSNSLFSAAASPPASEAAAPGAATATAAAAETPHFSSSA